MATYLELHGLASNSDLHDKVTVAVVKSAQTILTTTPTPTADRVKWAADVLDDPAGNGKTVLRLVLAANSAATVAQIQNATDASIQSNVDSAVDGLVLANATPEA